MPDVAARIASVLLAAVCVAVAVFLYGSDADGAFAIYDGAWYAHFAEHLTPHSILPHHPLFHIVVASLTKALRALAIGDPGHVAVRLVAGVGGAIVLLQIVGLAGRGRRVAGLAFAWMLFSTRGFLTEAATGENLFPAFAAALLVLRLATAEAPHLGRLGAAIVLATCLRQDNLLILPGALLAAWPALPRERRLLRVAAMLGVAGLVTIAFYVACWSYVRTATGEGVIEYLTRFGRTARWMGPAAFGTNALLHVGSLGAAVAGRFWFSPWPHVLVGAGWVGAILVGARFLRGAASSRRYAVAVVVTLAIRAPFFSWFEPHNFEWQLLPMTLLAAMGAKMARGEPRSGPLRRAVALAILGATGIATLFAHAPNLVELRARRVAAAVDLAIEAGGPHAYFLPMDKNAMLALELRRRQYEQLDIPFGAHADIVGRIAFETRNRLGRPVVVVADRFVETGMPYDLTHAGAGFSAFEAAPDLPDVTYLTFEGKRFAAILRHR